MGAAALFLFCKLFLKLKRYDVPKKNLFYAGRDVSENSEIYKPIKSIYFTFCFNHVKKRVLDTVFNLMVVSLKIPFTTHLRILPVKYFRVAASRILNTLQFWHSRP